MRFEGISVHQGKWRAENTVKTANGNELVDELKVATKAKVTYLTEEAHCRSWSSNSMRLFVKKSTKIIINFTSFDIIKSTDLVLH